MLTLNTSQLDYAKLFILHIQVVEVLTVGLFETAVDGTVFNTSLSN